MKDRRLHQRNYGRWNSDDAVIASAKGFTTLSAWRRKYPGAYAAARARRLLTKASAGMKRRRVWTAKALMQDANLYGTPGEWKRESPSAYATALNKGRAFFARCTRHMRRRQRWTRRSILASAALHCFRSVWELKESGAVDAARRMGIYEEATAHMLRLSSVGEYLVAEELLSLGVRFQWQASFPDLGRARFDFRSEEFQGALIEFHGEQHYKKRGRFADDFERRKRSDEMKERYAHDRGIPLLVEAVWKLFASANVIAPVRPKGVIDGAVRRRPGSNAECSLPRATR